MAGLLISINAFSVVNVGQSPKNVVLSGEKGSLVKGGDWDSSSLKGKVHVVFYVDPDENESNEGVIAALKQAAFPKDKFGTVAIINMDATWMPNIAIESKLKDRQKKFPDTTYVKDFKKILVKEWGLKDDAFDVMVFDASGKIIYGFEGPMPKQEIARMVDFVKASL
ncbi:MAG: transcriptional regulator [Oligoflexales bacterium]|nr:transcriptional regulator [Oligoflexales bacterium]